MCYYKCVGEFMKQKINKIMEFMFTLFVTISVKADVNCQQILGTELMHTLQNDVFNPIKIIAPVLLLVLTTVDFAKAIFVNEDKDGITKAKNNFVKRAVAALLVFFAPEILKLILGLANGDLTACLGSWS